MSIRHLDRPVARTPSLPPATGPYQDHTAREAQQHGGTRAHHLAQTSWTSLRGWSLTLLVLLGLLTLVVTLLWLGFPWPVLALSGATIALMTTIIE